MEVRNTGALRRQRLEPKDQAWSIFPNVEWRRAEQDRPLETGHRIYLAQLGNPLVDRIGSN